jgi:hypothetical protein
MNFIMHKSVIKCVFAFCALGFSSNIYAQAQWQDMYKVKKKDTMFGIAKLYGITVDELIKANPDMALPGYTLKKGDYIYIPVAKTQKPATPATTANNAFTAQPSQSHNASRTGDIRQRAINVGVMLPLHNVDGDGKRMTEYYRGFLMACENLKASGISVNVNAWNVAIDSDIRQTLLDPKAKECDIIFGPLYTKQVKSVADFCKRNGSKLVIPFSITANDVQTNNAVIQVYQTPADLNDHAIKSYLERFPDAHAVIVDCSDSLSDKGAFTYGLRKQLDARGQQYSLTSLKSNESSFANAFSKTKPNVVILNTGRSPQLNATFARLNSLTAKHPDLRISMFGYTEWLMYTGVYLELFHKYDAYIPTTFYYNSASTSTRVLEQQYRRWFRTDMQQALPRFALTGYDHAEYFLRGLHEHGLWFNGSRSASTYVSLQSPMHFVKVGTDGGLKNTAFMLVHYKKNGTSESINY